MAGFCNGAVTPIHPLSVIKHRRDGLALVRVRAVQAVRSVRAQAEQDGIAGGSGANVCADRGLAGLAAGVVTMESVCQPVFSAIMEDDNRGELSASVESICIFRHKIVVDLNAGLSATIDADNLDVQNLHVQYFGVWFS